MGEFSSYRIHSVLSIHSHRIFHLCNIVLLERNVIFLSTQRHIITHERNSISLSVDGSSLHTHEMNGISLSVYITLSHHHEYERNDFGQSIHGTLVIDSLWKECLRPIDSRVVFKLGHLWKECHRTMDSYSLSQIHQQ